MKNKKISVAVLEVPLTMPGIVLMLVVLAMGQVAQAADIVMVPGEVTVVTDNRTTVGRLDNGITVSSVPAATPGSNLLFDIAVLSLTTTVTKTDLLDFGGGGRWTFNRRIITNFGPSQSEFALGVTAITDGSIIKETQIGPNENSYTVGLTCGFSMCEVSVRIPLLLQTLDGSLPPPGP